MTVKMSDADRALLQQRCPWIKTLTPAWRNMMFQYESMMVDIEIRGKAAGPDPVRLKQLEDSLARYEQRFEQRVRRILHDLPGEPDPSNLSTYFSLRKQAQAGRLHDDQKPLYNALDRLYLASEFHHHASVWRTNSHSRAIRSFETGQEAIWAVAEAALRLKRATETPQPE